MVIPAAGGMRGAGGEFFRSNVTLTGYVNRLLVFWIGRGATGEPPAFEVAVADQFGYPITYTDFVGQTLHLENSLGARWFVPVDEDDDFDPTGVVDAFSRASGPISRAARERSRSSSRRSTRFPSTSITTRSRWACSTTPSTAPAGAS